MTPQLLDPLNLRFILDAFKLNGSGIAVPLSLQERKKFSTYEQAQEVFDDLPDGISQESIVDLLGQTIPGAVVNYRDADEEDGLFCLAIQATVTLKSTTIGQPDTVGVIQFNVGDILQSRFLLGDNRANSVLVLDALGQLHYAFK